jgi:hypothetical protein
MKTAFNWQGAVKRRLANALDVSLNEFRAIDPLRALMKNEISDVAQEEKNAP